MARKQTDQDMIDRLLTGDSSALEEVIQKYQPRVYNTAFQIIKDPNDAQEITQDVFFTVFRKIHTFKGDSAFYTWIYRITVNYAFMKIRSRRNRKQISFSELPQTEDNGSFLASILPDRSKLADERLVQKEFMDKVLASMGQLPDKYRVVFELRDLKQLTNEEVGQMLNLSLAAVKSRVHRARLYIREKIGGATHYMN